MSRSTLSTSHADSAKNQLSLFSSPLGWFGVVGRDEQVVALTFGHSSPGEVHDRLLADGVISRLTSPTDWWPQLRKRLQAYANGTGGDFADVRVVDTRTTAFQRAVVQGVRDLDYGQTLSYGELAERAGSPRAARAVGHVMATNPVPIIIPCHRIVASGGRLGGYSSPSGLQMKLRLLALEGVESLRTTPAEDALSIGSHQ